MKVPFLDLKAQYQSIKPALDAAIQGTVERAEFVGGPEVKKFEASFAQAHGTKHCIGVGNGTDAIQLSLRDAGVTSPRQQVLTTALDNLAAS